jgi:hypothetical protein
VIFGVLGFLIFALFGIGVIATLLGDVLESVSRFSDGVGVPAPLVWLGLISGSLGALVLLVLLIAKAGEAEKRLRKTLVSAVQTQLGGVWDSSPFAEDLTLRMLRSNSQRKAVWFDKLEPNGWRQLPIFPDHWVVLLDQVLAHDLTAGKFVLFDRKKNIRVFDGTSIATLKDNIIYDIEKVTLKEATLSVGLYDVESPMVRIRFFVGNVHLQSSKGHQVMATFEEWQTRFFVASRVSAPT